ncbi:MAG: tight adherence protein C, partial [Hyphomicrobiaceae bacterium]
MDYILSIINGLSDDPDVVQSLFTIIIGLAVVAFMLGAIFLFTTLFGRERARVISEIQSTNERSGETGSTWLAAILAPISRIATPGKKREFNKIRDRLSYAGFRSPNAVGVFYSIKLVAMIGLPVAVFISASFMPGVTQTEVMLAAWAAAAFGIIVPNKYLARKMNARQKRLRDGFPDA